MTPLAHAIVADSTLPLAKRQYGDATQRHRLLDNLHFFEVSAVCEMAFDLCKKMDATVIRKAERLAFLPAPRIWLEVSAAGTKSGGRLAYLLEENGDRASVTIISQSREGYATETAQIAWIPLLGSSDLGAFTVNRDGWLPSNELAANTMVCFLYALLAMINTPRVIGRTMHQPHAGLQRKIAAARSMPGKYPLHAWHELKLEVRPPRDEAGHEPRQTILTGGKALHFVRAYCRLQNGSLVLVSSHWKGDPALGIKQTRYRVVPQRLAA